MAIRFNAQADYLERTASLPASNSIAACGWIKQYSRPASSGPMVFFLGNSGTTNYFGLIMADKGDGNAYVFDHLGAQAIGACPADGTWIFWFIMYDGQYLQAGFQAAGAATLTSNYLTRSYSFTPALMALSGIGLAENYLDATIGPVKIWGSVFATNAELDAERLQYLPSKLTNLHLFSPFINTGGTSFLDISGNGRNWTEGGTVTDEDGPPIPWKMGRHRVLIPTSSTQSYSATMSGGALSGGSLVLTAGAIKASSGGALTGGAGTLKAGRIETPTAGALVGGSLLLKAGRVEMPVAGALAGGSWVLKRGRVEYPVSGGVVGGTASLLYNVLKTMSGGTVAGGLATIEWTPASETQSYEWVMVGGAFAGGAAGINFNAVRVAVGGGIAGGTTAYLRSVKVLGVDGGIVGGSSPQKSGVLWLPDGGGISGGFSVMLRGVEHLAVGGGVAGGSGDQLISAVYTTIGGSIAGGAAIVIRHLAGETLVYPKIILVDGKPALCLSKILYIEL